jgi:superfamily II DNA or RNA helicase
VCSPYLSDSDIKSIREGYKKREAVVEEALLRELNEAKNEIESERLNLLANLIADGVMDIKIAFTESGMYHEKLGIIEDSEGNAVVFSGSMNESATAIESSYETIDVYRSWDDPDQRVPGKREAFKHIWEGKEENLTTMSFPSVTDEIIKKYKRKAPNYEIDIIDAHQDKLVAESSFTIDLKNIPQLPPPPFDFHKYQKEAIRSWNIDHNCRGIFDMATGTGKTLTGLGAITALAEKIEYKLAVIIVCPYQHLVEQWVEDIEKFNMKPIIGYSTSFQKDWKKRLSKAIEDQSLREDKPFFCFICTNATFKSSFVQNSINAISSDILLLVDEAHNFGAEHMSKYLDSRFKYRLALSATLERHGDEEGTQILYDFFGEKCISYDLERAIAEEKLTPYKYYPIVVHLTPEELDSYEELSKQISKHTHTDKQGKLYIDDIGKSLAIKRSRIVAGAVNKLNALREVMGKYEDDYNLLVYCGATNVIDEDSDQTDTDEGDVKQIIAVTRILGNEFNMRVAKFTSEENIEERETIKKNFLEKNLQAIVAIKCLDEGVNIPGIKTAFILASTTNPKEYIQRRGRVLRLSPGKKYAEIYDFVTLPRELDSVSSLTEANAARDNSLVKNEIRRIKEFGRLSKNPMISEQLIDKIADAYNLDLEKIFKEEQ